MSTADADLFAVRALELRLLDPATRADPAAIDALLHAEFVEFGASGTVWTRRATIDELSSAPPSGPIEFLDMEGRSIGDDAVLLTFRTRNGDRTALRSSLWIREDDRWQLLFHQGTLIGITLTDQ